MNCGERYDMVFIDAYNDLSIPYHLTTREFARMIGNILKPDGIVLTNIIDNFQKGAFLPSYIRTLREVFGNGNVHVLSISPQFEKIQTCTFIVLASKDRLNIKDFETFLKNRYKDKATSAVVPEDTLNAFSGGLTP
jgi:spermidine synthase